MSVYFVSELRIFVIMGSTNDVCYFVFEMFVIMGSTGDVLLLCLMFFILLYFIIR